MASVGLCRAVSAPLFDVELAGLSGPSNPDGNDLLVEVLHQRPFHELSPEVGRRLTLECRYCAETGYARAIAELIRIGREVQRIGHTMHLAGAAAGSMIAYLARLTPLDPIEHTLLSERFMGPGAIEIPGIAPQGRPEDSMPDCFAANTSMTPQEFLVVLRRLGYSLSAVHDPTPEMFVSVHARRRRAAGDHQFGQLLVASSPTDAMANMLGEVSCDVLESDCQTWQLLHMGDTDGIDELNTSVLRDVLQEHEPACLLALADVLAFTRHGTVHGSEHGCPYSTVYEEDVMQLLGDALRVGLRESLWLIRRLAHAPSSQVNHIRDWFFKIESRRPLLPEERIQLWGKLAEEGPVAVCKAGHLAAAYRCLKAAYFKAHYPAEFRACLEVTP